MAVSRTNQTDGTLVFIGCSENETIEGETLSSIVGYVQKKLNATEFGARPKETYDKYCEGLKQKLGAFEPHHASAHIKECSKQKIITSMLSLLAENERVEKFKQLIERAADAAGGAGQSSFWYSEYNKEYKSSEFVVLKVFRSGENLEIIPTHLACHGSQVGSSVLFLTKAKSEAFIEIQQKKFVVSKFDIIQIIKKIKEQAEKSW